MEGGEQREEGREERGVEMEGMAARDRGEPRRGEQISLQPNNQRYFSCCFTEELSSSPP